jgi:ABC-2 type transport system permease protein
VFFRSIYLKTLRGFRVPIVCWGLGLGLLLLAVISAVPSLLATPEARAAIVTLGPSFAWFAEPVKIDTPGGYATWKYGLSVLIVALWPMLAESGMFRGEEERGSMDVLLSLPRSRFRVAVEKLAAMWTGLLLMALLIGLLALLGVKKANVDIQPDGTFLFGINLALIAGVFGAIALLISQFTQERRTAVGLTAGVLLVFIVLDMLHRVIENTTWLSQLSPIYYYNANKPLISGYPLDAGAFLVQAGVIVVLTVAAVWLFVRRDVGAPVALPRFLQRPERVRKPAAMPVDDWSLGSVYARSLASAATATFWWTLAIAALGAWFVVIVKQTESLLQKIFEGSSLGDVILKAGGTDAFSSTSLMSVFFIFLPLLLMAFAVTQANRWSSDEQEGRLELVLATPHSRLAVMLGQFAALSTAAVIVTVVTLGAVAASSALSGVPLDGGKLTAATLSMIPLALLIAAIGYLAAGWLRTAVETGLISFVLVIWFVISFLGPGLNWPDATLRLSAFYYYGSPLLHGLQIGDLAVIIAVGAAALLLAAYRFMRKDIAV